MLGIDVYVHVTFLLLLGFVGIFSWMRTGDLASVTSGLVFLGALFVCVLLHEYGHALAARQYGIPTKDITLLPIGGVARLERLPEKPSQELWVAIAGPLVNVVIAGALFVGLSLSGKWQVANLFNATEGSLAERLMMVNLMLVGFNLLPAFPMDGGRVLRALLAMRLDYARATRIAASIGKGMAVLFGLAGLFGNPMLLFIAIFVWLGASQESAAAQMKSSLTGALVREAMLTDFRTVSPEDSLGSVSRRMLAGCQQDFPVLQGDRVVGMLLHRDFFKALENLGEYGTVAEVMRREFAGVDAYQPLDEAMEQFRPELGSTRPVFREGQLIGLLTAENIGEFFLIRSAVEKSRPGGGAWSRQTPPPLPVPRSRYAH